jgi:hypothetical protein
MADKSRMKAMIAGRNKDFVRYHSSKDSLKTITFSSLDILPAIFTAEASALPEKVILHPIYPSCCGCMMANQMPIHSFA